jgi:hypothetical protein
MLGKDVWIAGPLARVSAGEFSRISMCPVQSSMVLMAMGREAETLGVGAVAQKLRQVYQPHSGSKKIGTH